MNVIVLAALILFSCLASCFAQGIQDDPSRRRLVLPSVRAATECIAREALNEPGIEGATGPGQFRAALASPMRRCADEVDAMISAHNQVYYPGFGEIFFRGPYLQDLVRAVQKRIGPELTRRSSEAVNRAEFAQQSASEFQTRRQVARPDEEKIDQAQRDTNTMWQPSRGNNAAPSPAPTTTMTAPAQSSVRTSLSTQSTESGWVLGGIGLLIMAIFGLREAAKRGARKRLYERLLMKYGDASIVERIMAAEMWQGMTAEMLTDSWGSPVDCDREVYKARTTETWKYGQTGRNRYKHRVVLENDVVVGFKQR